MCAQVQLGGVIYVLFCIVISLILLAFLPLVNFCFQLCFDSSVFLVTRGRRKPNTAAGGGQTAFTRATTAKIQSIGAEAQRRTTFRVKKKPKPKPKPEEPQRDSSGNFGKGSAFDPISESQFDAFDLDDQQFLSAQQRRRNFASEPTAAFSSFGASISKFTKRMMNMGVDDATPNGCIDEARVPLTREAEPNDAYAKLAKQLGVKF